MNKSELTDAVANKTGLTKEQSKNAINAVFDAITEAMQSNDSVNLIGFGSFVVRERAARTGRNPQTGNTITIAASKTPAFKAGKALKDAVK